MSALQRRSLTPTARAAVLERLPAPVVVAITQAEQAKADGIRRAAKEARRRKFEALLRERWPSAFRVPRPPLAIGIFDQILAAGADIDRYDLSRFMRWWCSRWDYFHGVAHSEMRLNLDGSPADVPTPEQQEHAAGRLWGEKWAARHLARIRARAG
jgi:sRNA-binding protein